MSIFSRFSFISTPGTFAAFRHRNYRLWFFGQLVSLIGTSMQNVAQGYLLFTLTGSVAFLGYVGFVSGLPSWLLVIFGGLIADRVPRRTLLVITQSVKMMLAFILGALVLVKMVQPWHILTLALLLGMANAVETPARKSLVVDLVQREDMTNAITLIDAMYYSSVIIGPAIAVVVYSLIGPSWCFLLNGISFIAVIAALLIMQTQSTPLLPQRGSPLADLGEGFHYVRGNRLVQTLITSELLLSIIGYGPLILLPAWAVKILNGDVATNGLLLSVFGIGAVLGGLLIATLASRRNRGKVWTSGSIIMPLAMFAFALSRNLPLSLFCLGWMGLSYLALETNNSAIVQSSVPDELRGRVIGLFTLMYTGGEPLGALAVGLLADKTSEPIAFYICSIGMMLFAFQIWLRRPEVRAIK
jgi:MFS family permease